MPKDFILYALFGGHFFSELVVRTSAFLLIAVSPCRRVFVHSNLRIDDIHIAIFNILSSNLQIPPLFSRLFTL